MQDINAHANPSPSHTRQSVFFRLVWTFVPVVILAAIAIASFQQSFAQFDVPKPELTVKVTGKVWFWSYAYPDNGNFQFDSLMIQDKDLKPGQPRLLSVNHEMIIPVNKIVHLQVTSADVIHSFNVPAFGIRVDAVPGRLNDTWFKATTEGIFYGECTVQCGANDSFMPIAMHVVSNADFNAWAMQETKKYFADAAAVPTSRTMPTSER
jgi:cytochrome c oxidase subunit II